MAHEIVKNDANNQLAQAVSSQTGEIRNLRVDDMTLGQVTVGVPPSMYSLLANASTNPLNVKNAAGRLFHANLTNNSAAVKYFRLYNLAVAPTVGTSAPYTVITLPATSSKEVTFGPTGLAFSVGIAIAITGAAPDLDATAVAAGDVRVLLAYM